MAEKGIGSVVDDDNKIAVKSITRCMASHDTAKILMQANGNSVGLNVIVPIFWGVKLSLIHI